MKKAPKSTSKKARKTTTSQLVSDLIEKLGESKSAITIGDVLKLMDGRVFGMAILVFAIPNALPIPNIPGFSAITGLPILLFAVQMLMGRRAPWLPKVLAERTIARGKLLNFLKKSLPYIKKAEKFFKPRLAFMTGKIGQIFVGLCCVLLAIVISLPIPFGNMIPGILVSLLAIGLIQQDGLVMSIGIALGAVIFLFTGEIVVEALSDALSGL